MPFIVNEEVILRSDLINCSIMLNQAAVDALCSATYVENYMDCVENLPDDIQRYLTRMHELDVSYRGYLKDVDIYKEMLEREDLEVSAQRRTLYKLEQVLISLQEVGDEKVEIGQHINDLIDNKYRQLDQDLRNLDFHKEAEATELRKETIREIASGNIGSGSSNNNGSTACERNNGGQIANAERASKRSRRTRTETESTEPPPIETRTSTSSKANTSGSGSGSKSSSTAAAKKKKRKCRQREESPPREEEVVHDIDEPTYCLCDQISYGEMIMCDNDLCPIEWFHFVCVSLVTKPKGKWFCPRCRGDRPNVMKPKSQFLKELERYNKEKEEKA